MNHRIPHDKARTTPHFPKCRCSRQITSQCVDNRDKSSTFLARATFSLPGHDSKSTKCFRLLFHADITLFQSIPLQKKKQGLLNRYTQAEPLQSACLPNQANYGIWAIKCVWICSASTMTWEQILQRDIYQPQKSDILSEINATQLVCQLWQPGIFDWLNMLQQKWTAEWNEIKHRKEIAFSLTEYLYLAWLNTQHS